MIYTISIKPYWILLVVFIGFLVGVTSSIAFVKGKRGEAKEMQLKDLLIISVFFSAPGCLLVYLLSDEIRTEDRLHSRKYLIALIISFVIEILIIFLLYYFGLVAKRTNPQP